MSIFTQARIAVLSFVIVFATVALCSDATVSAQAKKQDSSAANEVLALIKKLKSKDSGEASDAGWALVHMGPSIIPTLLEVLKNETGCEMRFIVSGIVFQIEPAHPIVNATLVDVIRGRCSGIFLKDQAARRDAAFALIAKEEGIAIMASMLSDKDRFNRRSAAFAFDELTERLSGRPPEISATPARIEAIKAAMPLLVRAFADKDKIVRCMSLESMEQLQSCLNEELRNTANTLMKQAPPCSCDP